MGNWQATSNNSYLTIARMVLQAVRRPLTPRQIMLEAYKSGFVPEHLHGRTQHKTLQARLSEDILRERDRSAFFRTAPGKFFLREFISDEQLPVQFRTPIVARRRIRDLPKKGILALKKIAVEHILRDKDLSEHEFQVLVRSHQTHYLQNIQEIRSDDILVWSFVIVARGNQILSYRQGQYREGRDAFRQKRCIGFYNLVTGNDLTLFDQDDHGILGSGIKAVSMDLDLPIQSMEDAARMSRCGFVYSRTDGRGDLLGLIKYDCPDWFEPIGRRLSLNDLAWLDATHVPNDPNDFDPWSQLMLKRVRDEIQAAN
ncbi:MAG: hypothetical protein CMN64_08460 [Sphingobium sp.]|jgi:hypothetical protein|nr:hypothetical protein [Sphingobium sp.]